MMNSRSPIAAATASAAAGTVNCDCGGIGHRASQGWCGSSLIIRPLASDSTLPSASVMVAVMNSLPPVDRVDPAARHQWLVDRGDLAVVDVQVGGAAVGTARGGHDHAEMPVVEQRDHAAVHGVVAADVEAAEVPAHGDAVGSGLGRPSTAASGDGQCRAGRGTRPAGATPAGAVAPPAARRRLRSARPRRPTVRRRGSWTRRCPAAGASPP